MAKITKRLVESLRPRLDAKDLFVWDQGDGALKGFGIRLKPSGIGSYLIQYRNADGRTRRYVLGRVGVLTPDQARTLATAKFALIAQGTDPSAQRVTIRRAMRVDELCEAYLRDAVDHIKASTLYVDKSRINAHVIPLLGSRTVVGLTRADLEQFQTDISNGRTARREKNGDRWRIVLGGKGVASRTLGMLHTILEFAVTKGLISSNPATGIKKFQDKKRTRYLSPDELARFGVVLSQVQQVDSIPVAAIRALLLTGCRRNEILSLRVDALDIRAKCLRLQDTKSGGQLRPLGKAAATLLEEIRLQNHPNKYLFPSARGDGHFIGLPKVLKRLCLLAGLQDVTLHTFRHTFAAVAAELGLSELTIAGLLGHRMPGVTARYAHIPDSALITAADKVSERISKFLEGQHMLTVVNFPLALHG